MINFSVKIMKYRIFILISLLVIFLGGCKKAPIDDNVQGFWILKEFTTLHDGELHKCERLFYSIGRFVTELTERQGPNGYGHYVGITEFRDDNKVLVLKDFLDQSKSTADTAVPAPVEGLQHYGINSQEETVFDIVFCNGKRMTLKSDYAVLELEKF